ncbi:MAG: DUF1573 domain-containing protein [Candidatus Margulisiibacteriota bacterium]
MKNNADKRLYYLLAVGVVVVVVGIIAGLAGEGDNNGGGSIDGKTAQLNFDEKRFDFGRVSMADGKISHRFKFKNEGEGDLTIDDLFTSCMCTNAALIINGKKGPSYGMPMAGQAGIPFWNEQLKPGEEAELEVTFDPNAHGPDGTGPITRAITLVSNDSGINKSKTDLIITAKVIK